MTPGSRIALLGAIALTLAGCGDAGDTGATGARGTEQATAVQDTGSAGSGAAPADCPLTAEQVTAVLGVDMAPHGTGCSFTATDGTFAEVYYSAVSMDVFAADEPTALDGVGDEAYLGPSQELYVRAGDRGFAIHVLVSEISSGIDGGAAQVELARLVADSAG